MAAPIRVKNLAQFQRSIRAADKALAADFRDALAESAQPVKVEAERLAVTNVRGIRAGDPWSRMRVGVRSSVSYVAPVERGVNVRGNQRFRRGHKFKNLVLDRAMEPALERKRGEIARRFEQMVTESLKAWSRG